MRHGSNRTNAGNKKAVNCDFQITLSPFFFHFGSLKYILFSIEVNTDPYFVHLSFLSKGIFIDYPPIWALLYASGRGLWKLILSQRFDSLARKVLSLVCLSVCLSFFLSPLTDSSVLLSRLAKLDVNPVCVKGVRLSWPIISLLITHRRVVVVLVVGRRLDGTSTCCTVTSTGSHPLKGSH